MLTTKAAELLRAVRADSRMTQVELAAAAGIHQPTLAGYESGRRRPSELTLRRLLIAAKTRPSIPLQIMADEIIAAAGRHHLDHVRVFGSTLTGDDTATSDIDLLVRPKPGASLFDLSGFTLEVEALTGFAVDVITEQQASSPHFAHVLTEAVPV